MAINRVGQACVAESFDHDKKRREKNKQMPINKLQTRMRVRGTGGPSPAPRRQALSMPDLIQQKNREDQHKTMHTIANRPRSSF